MLPGADADVLAVVQRRSEGNPLFVSQVARLLGPGAATVEEVPVPAGIRQAVRRQVARLGQPEAEAETEAATGDNTPTAQEILATAAALGPGIDPALVAAALDVPAGPVARLCDDATAIGLLGPGQDVGEVYRFRHALIRETLYAELSPQSRAQAHHRIAAVLENSAGPGHAELAYHFLRAAPASAEAAARAVHHSRLAGQTALTALAYEEAAGHFRHALDVQRRAAQATPASRAGLLLSLAEALTKTGPDPAAARVIDEAIRLARDADEPRLLAAAALLNAQHLDFNAPADTATALLREAAAALDPADHALRARTLARLAITLAAAPAEARDTAERAVLDAREAASRDPDQDAAATALATALTARHYVLWGTQDPADALAAADDIVTAAQRARAPETELDGRVLRLTHLLELGDGPAAQRVLPELDRMAEWLRQPAVRLAALSRRSTLAALTGDFGAAAENARQAFQTGQAAGLPDAGAVYWGQLFAIWLHAGLPAADEQWMERELRDLVARSNLSVAHAAALVQVEAAHGAVEQARGRLDELVGTGLGTHAPGHALPMGADPARPRLRRAAGGRPRATRLPGPGPLRRARRRRRRGGHVLRLHRLLPGRPGRPDRRYRGGGPALPRGGRLPPAARRPAHARAHPARARAAAGPFRRVGGARRGPGHRRRLRHDQAARRPRPGRTAPQTRRPHPAARRRFLARRLRGHRHPGTGQPGPALPGPAHPPARPGPGRPGPGPARGRHRPGRHRDHQKTDCTTRPEPGPTRSSTSRPGPPTGSASPPSTRTSPKPRRGTTPSGPAACAPRRTSWSASSPPRPGSAAGHGASARNPNAPGSTSPGPSGPPSPRSATAPRPPPPTSTGRPDRDPLLLLPAQRVAPGCPKVPGTPPLVGRDDERDRLVAAWHAAASGHPQLVLVTGEAGVGKTRLVDELRAHAGAVTAEARGYPAEGLLAYGVATAWLRSGPAAARLTRLVRPDLTELARLLPELAARYRRPSRCPRRNCGTGCPARSPARCWPRARRGSARPRRASVILVRIHHGQGVLR